MSEVQTSTEKEAESKVALPLAGADTMLKVVDVLLSKGGKASFDVVQTAMGKSGSLVGLGASAAATFGLVRTVADSYELTEEGSPFAAAGEADRKVVLMQKILSYEPYHTVLFRVKNGKDNALPKLDITKAWYDLNQTGTQRTREQYTSAFASLCEYAGLIENRKKTVVLTTDGAKALEGAVPTVTKLSLGAQSQQKSGMTIQGQAGREMREQAPPFFTTNMTIQLSVDATNDKAVENLIDIIKTLRGEKVERRSQDSSSNTEGTEPEALKLA